MKNTVPTLEALIFDVDGTLSDTEEIHRLAFNHSFKYFGLSWVWPKKEYRALLKISGGKERIKYYATNHDRQNLLSDSLIHAIHDYKNRSYQSKIVEKNLKLRPGIHKLIESLYKSKVKIGIATSSSLENIDKLLNNCIGNSWRDVFDEIETSDSSPKKKPDPSVYKNILSKLKVDPKKAVALEDTPNGLKSAIGAGISTIITVHEMTKNLAFPEATLVIDSVGTPTKPFTLVDGDPHGWGYVSLELLNIMIQQNYSIIT